MVIQFKSSIRMMEKTFTAKCWASSSCAAVYFCIYLWTRAMVVFKKHRFIFCIFKVLNSRRGRWKVQVVLNQGYREMLLRDRFFYFYDYKILSLIAYKTWRNFDFFFYLPPPDFMRLSSLIASLFIYNSGHWLELSFFAS